MWIGKMVYGGMQCDTSFHFTPPNTKSELTSVDIEVYDTYIEHYMIAAVCGAASYAALHYALIGIEDVENSQHLGFEIIESPYPSRRR